ncbi:PTS sugar transporter subunit IIA [Lacticaseibacillus paracasei]|uniref:PTS system mannose-specific EIIAB component n=3 Tax=Lacticaseibacillus paracasei TaxID=1597 RepID=A0A8E0M8E5_LACPA|nr:PTS mannose EIIAB component [Lacticaseibacillus paracasei]EPC49959.1 PTS system mannose-specific EIIAB component [Lacticaseibacillus paracasei subsp. paracasei CNCM I-4270]QOP54408.1 PTS mannose transporter subunit IIAB [Lacticaseibacillus paracasei]
MIKYMFVTHGELAKGMMDAVRLIMGEDQEIYIDSISHKTSIHNFGKKVANTIVELDEGDGVIVLTDLALASPYNQASLAYKRIGNTVKYKVIAGTNLPMMLEAVSQRLQGNNDIEDVTQRILMQGRDGVKEFFEELNKYTETNPRNGFVEGNENIT